MVSTDVFINYIVATHKTQPQFNRILNKLQGEFTMFKFITNLFHKKHVAPTAPTPYKVEAPATEAKPAKKAAAKKAPAKPRKPKAPKA